MVKRGRSRMSKRIVGPVGSTLLCLLGLFIVLAAAGPLLGTTRLNFINIRGEGGAVVSAIEKYQTHHGTLPGSLDDLLPDYRPSYLRLPTPGRRPITGLLNCLITIADLTWFTNPAEMVKVSGWWSRRDRAFIMIVRPAPGRRKSIAGAGIIFVL